jgi:hypothetical protein
LSNGERNKNPRGVGESAAPERIRELSYGVTFRSAAPEQREGA